MHTAEYYLLIKRNKVEYMLQHGGTSAFKNTKRKMSKAKEGFSSNTVFIFVKRGPGYPNYPIKKKETLPTSKLEIKNLFKTLL